MAVALVLASFLHLPLLWILMHSSDRALEAPRRSPAIFQLQAQPLRPQAPEKKPVSPPKPDRSVAHDGLPLPGPHEAIPSPIRPQEEPRRPNFSAGLLSQQISEVSESLVKKRNAESQGKRIVYASDARGHTATLTAYEEAWQAKVEHIGNLNYPEAARNQGLSGSLNVAVAIRPDGSLYSVQILKSSGNPIIDEGAIKIVRLSAPFAPLPQDLLRDIDILVITRSWRFDDQAHFSSK